MKFPLESNQFTARVTSEDLTLLNEIIPEILPDRELSDTSLTGREILMALAETSSLKLRKMSQSQPADLKKIEELYSLTDELNTKYKTAQKDLDFFTNSSAEKDDLIEQLRAEISETKNQLSGISIEHTAVKEKALKLEKYVPVRNEMRIVLQPLTARVLNMYAEKIRLKNRTETQPGDILTSLFNRYITLRETELPGFPFLISKNEILEIKKQLENEPAQ